VACAVGPSVTTFSTDFSFQNLVFWNLFEFSMAEISLESIAPTFRIQILPNKIPLIQDAHQDLSNNTKGTYTPIPPKFSATM
jgi:hypothetical protein